MNNLATLALIFGIQEITAYIAFYFIRRKFEKTKSTEKIFFSIFKGILERSVLFFGLVSDLPVVVTFFAALKVATKLTNATDPSQQKVSNDYFLVGNLTSILLVLISYGVFKRIAG